jgi:hypothetical protein
LFACEDLDLHGHGRVGFLVVDDQVSISVTRPLIIPRPTHG